jgi:hypothetical protein
MLENAACAVIQPVVIQWARRSGGGKRHLSANGQKWVFKKEGAMSFFNPELDQCVCGHLRGGHEYDADFDEGSWHSYWLHCETCSCEKFEEEE